MTDVFSETKRRWIMSRVAGYDTKPELLVRRAVHSMGYRYRLHVSSLPGTPDIVLPRHRKIILVHGCFWHGHEACPRARRPSTHTEFWNLKLDNNIRRDTGVLEELKRLGWDVLVVWECETKNDAELRLRLAVFLAKKGS